MQTAEEILRQTHAEFSAPNPTEWKAFDEIMTDGTGEAMIKSMKEYARQACEEQRKLCLKNAVADWGRTGEGKIDAYIKDYTITNAPTPELK